MKYEIVGQYIKIEANHSPDAIAQAVNHANSYAEDQEYEEVAGIQEISRNKPYENGKTEFVYLVTYKNRVFGRPREI